MAVFLSLCVCVEQASSFKNNKSHKLLKLSDTVPHNINNIRLLLSSPLIFFSVFHTSSKIVLAEY